MPKVVPIHWKTFEKFLFSVGCELVRERGDHRVYSRAGLKRPVVIPRDTQLPVFIIRNNLRILGISSSDYLKILEEL